MIRHRMLAFALAAAVAGGGLAACQEEGPAERAGRDVDRAVEDAREAARDVGERLEDAARDVGDAVEEAARDAEDAIGEQ